MPKHGSRQQQEEEREPNPRIREVIFGLSSFRPFVSQAHSNRSIALLLIFKGAGGGSGMLHHTKVNDCVTEAGCDKQPGMTHFPEGWTRLGRRRRWLASPSGLARERAREKKKKKRGARSILASVADGRCRSGGGRDTRARGGKKNSWLVAAGWLAGWGWARTGTCQTGPPTLWCAYDAPSLHRPKAWAGEATKTRKQAVKSGALCPLPAFPAGPSPRGQQRQGAGDRRAPSVPRGGEGMVDVFQVWLGGLTHVWLTHPFAGAGRTS